MSKFNKKYTYPLVLLFVGAFLLRLLDNYTSGVTFDRIIVILKVALLFSFGLALNLHSKRKQTWVKKVVVSFIVVFLTIYSMGFIVIPQVAFLINFLGIYGFVLDLVFIFCGWTFFD